MVLSNDQISDLQYSFATLIQEHARMQNRLRLIAQIVAQLEGSQADHKLIAVIKKECEEEEAR